MRSRNIARSTRRRWRYRCGVSPNTARNVLMKWRSDTTAIRASRAMSSGSAYDRSMASRARSIRRFVSSVARLISTHPANSAGRARGVGLERVLLVSRSKCSCAVFCAAPRATLPVAPKHRFRCAPRQRHRPGAVIREASSSTAGRRRPWQLVDHLTRRHRSVQVTRTAADSDRTGPDPAPLRRQSSGLLTCRDRRRTVGTSSTSSVSASWTCVKRALRREALMVDKVITMGRQRLTGAVLRGTSSAPIGGDFPGD